MEWRKGLALGALLAAMPAVASAGEPPQTAAFAAINPVTPLNAGTFADPPQNDKPWARWNFPPASATIAGPRGRTSRTRTTTASPGWRSARAACPTTDQLVAIYNKAQRARRDDQPEGRQRASGRDRTSNTDPYARRTLEASKTAVDAGASFNGAVTGTATGTIVAVQAFRCTATPCPATGIADLDRSSVIDLTSTLTGTNTSGYQGGTTAGTLSWTAPAAPAGAQWLVIVFRAIPFGTTPEPLSPQGTKELTDAYDAYFAGPLGPLVKANKRRLLRRLARERSVGRARGAVELEHAHASSRRARATTSSRDLPALFDSHRCRRGTRAVLQLQRRLAPTASARTSTASAARSTRRTAWSPFQNWARTYNMKLRLQQEDGPTTSLGDSWRPRSCSTGPSTSR